MSLSADQIAAVQASWAVVKGDLKNHATKFFCLLLQKNPAVNQKYFSGINPANPASAEAQAVTVFNSVGQMVDSLGNIDAQVKALAASHKPRNVGKDEFALAFDVLNEYLAPIVSADQAAAWKAFGACVANQIGAAQA